jgi:flagellin
MSAINGLSSLRQLDQTQAASAKSIQKITSGSQYPSASDGASAYSILVRMYSNIDASAQYNSNTQTANAMLSTAAGGVSSTVDALSSLQQQLMGAANGTNSQSDIAAIGKNVNQTIAAVNDNASVKFNGQSLLDGSQQVTVAGEHGYTNTRLGDMTAQGLGLTDKNGKSVIDLSSQKGIASALDTVNKALDKALNESTNIGAAQQNLSSASANYTTQQTNLTAAASTMGDTDLASEVTKLKSSQTQNALALYAAKLNMHSRSSVLALLQ